ncbi:MAG: hypothetical protein IKF90_18555, partial [Parasporobacterium sp.]|nr:hypothetical protein [Parasporobacterium sp.]
EITGTDGSVIVSNNATLDLDNREETKTVFYVREYALEQGQSLDLSTVGLGSGTISLSEDASTVRMNQVKFDNSGHNVYDDVLIPAISLMLDTNNNEKESYHIQLVGENVINNTFTSPEGNGISLMLSSRDEVVTPKFIFESGSEDPAGTLTLYGGTRGISAEGGEVVLDADVHVARHQQEEHQYDFLDGIVGDAVTVKAGRTIDLKVNGAGFSVTGGLAIGENAKVTIDTVAPRINGGNLGTAPEGIIHVYNSANGQAALRNDYIPGSLRSVLGNGGEEEQGGTVMTYKAAIFAGGGVVSLAPGSDVTITGSGKPETKAKIGGFAGIMLQNGAALEADSAALGINMSADPGEEIYATNFSCINGGDNGNVTFKNSEVDLGISSDSIYNGCGILTNGDVDIEDSFVGAMISVHGDIYGIAPEGALTVKDSTVFSLSQSYEEESINYGVCAGELHMSFAGENQGLLARAENKDGIAILVKNGKGNKPVGYDPDYKAKKIILTDDIGITAPEDYAINQTSIKGSLSPWLYMETVYDKQDTTKPSNAVLFEYQKSLADAAVTISPKKFIYDGTKKTPRVVRVVLDGKELIENLDYTVSYKNNIKAGTGEVIVTGRGSYKDSVKQSFTINAKKLTDSNVKLKKTSYPYTGSAINAPVIVKDGTKTLKEGVDYNVKYTNNKNAGTGEVIVTGRGNYKDSVKLTFTITAKKLTNSNVKLKKTSYPYTGSAIKAPVIVKDGTKTLKEGVDYKVRYTNNKNAGTAKATVTGINNYQGAVTKNFTITKAANGITKFAPTSKTLKYNKIKSQTIQLKAAARFGTKVAFEKASVTPAKASTYFTVSKAGKVTVKKGTPRGTYTLKVKVTSAGTKNYAAKTVTKSIKITVK